MYTHDSLKTHQKTKKHATLLATLLTNQTI
jgi:hypothetical protein